MPYSERHRSFPKIFDGGHESRRARFRSEKIKKPPWHPAKERDHDFNEQHAARRLFYDQAET